ncbi:MAG TPA: glycosyltransferase [Saprospiraceae bacterium]|nr:glycosyltransferase [Saprospiraceae bacterium]
MKIIILGTAYPFRGGLASFNERLATELQKMGHEVIIYTFTKQYPDFLFPGKTQFSESVPPENLTILRKIHSYHPLNWYKVGRQLQKEAPDLLITRFWIPFIGPSLGTIIKQAKKRKPIPTISIIDNIVPHESRPGDRQLSLYFTKQVDRFVVLSKFVGEQLKDFITTQPIDFAPHPIYDNYGEKVDKALAIKHLGLDPSQRYILFFGFIRDYKGLDLLLEAMATDTLRKQNIQLIVAGEYYSNEEKYQDLIDQLRIKDKLKLFNNFIPNDEVKYYFSAADLVVQTYKSATQSGISQIAMHFEVPMVVTDVGGLKEIVLDQVNGYITAKDPASIAKTVLRYYQENKESAFKQKIIEEKKKYAWSYFADVLLNGQKENEAE